MCSPIEEAMKKRASSRQVLEDCDQKLRGFGVALAELCTSLQAMARPNDRITLTADGKSISVSDNLNLKPGAIGEIIDLIKTRRQAILDLTHAEQELSRLGTPI